MFAALAGEPFGGLGSRALAAALANGTLAEALDVAEVVALELGQVGTPGTEGALVARGAPNGASAARDALVSAGAAPAAAAPGAFPPGSLSAFATGLRLHGLRLASGAVLAEYDGSFQSRRFRSRGDTALNATHAAGAASALARALVALGAASVDNPDGLSLEAARPIAGALADCLALAPRARGMRCSLASALMTASAPRPGWYVGVLPRPPPASDAVAWERAVRNDGRDVPLFAWSFLANSTQRGELGGGECTFGGKQACRDPAAPFAPGACLAYQANFTRRKGTCAHASAALLPSVPAAMRADGRGRWAFDPAGLAGGAPAWTESYWGADAFACRVYMEEPAGMAAKLVLGGAAVALGTWAAGKGVGAVVVGVAT